MKHIAICGLLLVSLSSFAQTGDFPYQERDWATYMIRGAFDAQGNLFFGRFTNDGPTYEINPYDSLQTYVTNPESTAFTYFGKLSSDQNIPYVKLYGPPPDSSGSLLYYFFGGVKDFDPSGNIYICGFTQSTEGGISTEGAPQENFSNHWSDPYEVYYPEVDATITMPPVLCADTFIMKYNTDGEKLWGSYYNGNQQMRSNYLLEQNQYLYVFGTTTSYEGVATPGTYIDEWGDEISHHIDRPFLKKIDADNGEPVWGTYLSPNEEHLGYAFTATVNSNGYTYYIDTDTLRILSPMGSLVTELPTHLDPFSISSLQADKLGNIYILGATIDNDAIGTPGTFRPTKTIYKQEYLIKYNQMGEKVWGTYLMGVQQGEPHYQSPAFYAGKLDLYLATSSSETGLGTPGAYQEENAGGKDIVFMKLNGLTGEMEWLSYYGGTGEDKRATAISIDLNENLYLSVLKSNSPSASIISEDALFPYPINEKRSFTVKFIHEKNLSVENHKTTVLKVFPNPAKKSIALQSPYELSSETKISIYDIFGRKIISIKGNNSKLQTIDVSMLSSGVYFISLAHHNKKESVQFIKQ